MFDSRFVKIFISLCLLSVLIACGSETLPQEPVASQPSHPMPQPNVQFDSSIPEVAAVISIVEGEVQVLRVDVARWEDAIEGMELTLDDMIKTGNDGTALIVFFEGSTIELEPNTEILIQELGIASGTGSTTIKLWQKIGTTVNHVQKLVDSESQYEIQTPAGSAVVRGSVGRVIVLPNGMTLVYNESGEWWVYAQGQMVQIPPNWYVTIILGHAPGQPVQGPIPGQPPSSQDPYEGNGEGDYPGATGVTAAPVAQFTSNIVSGIAPLAVQFTDQSTGTITSWSWDFGDGISDEKNPAHTFTAPGTYTVTLTVSGPDGHNTLIMVDYIVVWGSWTSTTTADFSDGFTMNTEVINKSGDDGSIVLTVNVPSVALDQLPSNFTNDFWYPVYSNNYQAQIFRAGISGCLIQADIQLRAFGSPAPLIVELRDCNFAGGNYVPGNTVLGRTIIAAVPIEGNYPAIFLPTIIGVTAGQYYSIVLYQQGNGGTAGDYYELGGTGGDYYLYGNAFSSSNDGTSWNIQTVVELPEDHYFETYVGQYYPNGYYESLSYDCGAGATFGNISWTYNALGSAAVKFQVATNNDDSTWNFVGPDGTSSTFYDTSNTALWSGHTGDRYIKYKAYLIPGVLTPELQSVTIYYR